MAQMTAAARACHLNTAHAVAIVGSKRHATGNSIVKTRPAAMCVKLLLVIKQLLSAGRARICARIKYAIVFAAKRRFGRLVTQDFGLLASDSFEVRFVQTLVVRLGVFLFVESV